MPLPEAHARAGDSTAGSYRATTNPAKLLLGLLDLTQPQPVQLAALATLARFNDPQVGAELTQRWNSLTPRLRAEALTALLAAAERATALLAGHRGGRDPAECAGLDADQIPEQSYRDPAVRQLAAKVLAAQPASTRQAGD